MRCLLTPSFKTGDNVEWVVGLSSFTNTLTAKYPTQPTALRVERLEKPRPRDLSRGFPRDPEFYFLKIMIRA
jgi:hypothetical protein